MVKIWYNIARIKFKANIYYFPFPLSHIKENSATTVFFHSPNFCFMKNLPSSIEQEMQVLTKQAGYVGIGIDTSGAGIPEPVLSKFKFDEKGNSTQRLTGSFDFSAVTGSRRIQWEREGKQEHSYVLEGVKVTSEQQEFSTSIPYAGYLQMKEAGDDKAEFTLKQTPNKANTRMYYSVRLVGLAVNEAANTKKAAVPAA